jgi:hypothetical protein
MWFTHCTVLTTLHRWLLQYGSPGQAITGVCRSIEYVRLPFQLFQTRCTCSYSYQRWLATGIISFSGPRRPRARLVDPYKAFLLSRWQQSCHNGAQLERELRTKGYKGSGRALYRYLETLEPSGFSSRKRGSAPASRQMVSRETNPLLALSAQQATWLFFRMLEDLKQEALETLR